MADLDISRLFRYRLLAELHGVMRELLLREQYGELDRLLQISEDFEEAILQVP